MTESIQEEIEHALTQTLAPWLVNEDVLNMINLHHIEYAALKPWRGGDITSVSFSSYWFSLTILAGDVRILVIGAPGDGLTETCILADYAGMAEFNDLAHFYLNPSVDQTAVDDYRPIRYRENPMGTVFVDPDHDWDYEGYIIRIEEQERSGDIRSTVRDYITKESIYITDWDRDVSAIDFSLSYSPL